MGSAEDCDRGRNQRRGRRGHPGQGVAHDVDSAVPGRAGHHVLDRGDQAAVVAADHDLYTGTAAFAAAQELGPARAAVPTVECRSPRVFETVVGADLPLVRELAAAGVPLAVPGAGRRRTLVGAPIV